MRPALPLLFLSACLVACQPAETPAALMDKAAKLQARVELRAAVIELRNAVQADGNHAAARRQLAGVYLAQGDGAAAEKELRRAASLKPLPGDLLAIARTLVIQGQYEAAQALLLDAPAGPAVDAVRGQAHIALGETVAAGRAFEAALARDPANLDALLGQAQLAALAHDAEGADKMAAKALQLHPSAPDALRFVAALRIDAGKREEALGLLRQALAVRPGDPNTHLDVAKLLIDHGKFKEAQASIDSARRSASGGLHIVHTLALLAFRQGRHAEAREHVQQILKVAPDYPPALLLSGAIGLSRGTGQLAVPQLERFLAAHPGHLHASRLLGAAQLQSGQAVAAAAVSAKALKAHPDDAELLAIAGEAALRLGRHAEAAGLFERASTAAPGQPALRAAAGLSSLGAGDTARAIAELEKLPDVTGPVSRSGVVLVLSHLKARKPDAALAVITRLEAQGANPYLLNLKGAAQVAAGDPAAARASFEAALKRDVVHWPALDNLAQLDAMQGKVEVARQRYQAALQRTPNDPALLESMARFEARHGNPQAALRLLKQSAAAPTDPVASARRLSLLAGVQRQAGQYAAAAESYRELAATSPLKQQAMHLRATVQIEGRDFTGALDTLSKSLLLQPDDLDAYALQVAALGALGRSQEALAAAAEVKRRWPASDAGYQLEGDVHMASRRWRDAARAYQAGLAVRKNGMFARLLHGALARDGRTQEADNQLAAWVRQHPADFETRLYHAGTLVAAGRIAMARSEFESLDKLRPEDPVVLNELALAYHTLRDPRALPTARRALALAPADPKIRDTVATLSR